MIIKKHWTRNHYLGIRQRDYVGWFLFGIIPLYIVRSDWY